MHSQTKPDRPPQKQTLVPFYECPGFTLHHGDLLQVLPELEQHCFDAAILDPPYCSGGLSLAERSKDPREKYCQNGDDVGRPSF